MKSISRNAQVLHYLLCADPGVGRTKLANYAYLADLEARKYLGRPISAFRYRFDSHGPFDARAFCAATREMEQAGLATESEVGVGDYIEHRLMPTSRGIEYGFTLAEAKVLDYVVQTYLSTNAREICVDIVYQTEPMMKAKRGQLVPMSIVDRVPGKNLGFDLERMLAGEADAKAGRTRPLDAVVSELRARTQ
jgi:hypothetical protein